MKKSLFKTLAILGAVASFAALAPKSSNAASTFYVSGRTLYDANGNKFVPQGVNNPHIWFVSQAYNALPGLASRKCNIIRIVWETSGGAASDLQNAIAECVSLKMVPMVELHNGTGDDNASDLTANANYYASSSILPIIKQYQKYIMLNIANEWSDGNETTAAWDSAYKPAITILRNAGLTCPLVIDNPGYGQNYEGGLQYGQDLENYDPSHNILFSVHMYYSFNNSSAITSCDSGYYNANLPLVIGEFGYDDNNGNNNLSTTVNDSVVMQTAINNGYGYIAWSTQGNDSADAWLDLLNTDWSTLMSPWGTDVFTKYSYSITNSAQTASVFNSSGGQAIANGTYKIINRLSGLALDAYNNGTANGTVVDQWPYGGGNNQRWIVTYEGNNQYKIENVNAQSENEVLDATGSGGSGTWTELYASNNGQNQLWQATATSSGYYVLSPAYNTGLALDDYGASTSEYNTSTNNGRIDVWSNGGTTNQQWSFQSP